MANQVVMPKLGLTMTTGTIMKWFFKEGDQVNKGDILFEVMTDKAAVEVDSPVAGTLLKILAEVDAVVPVNAVVAYIGQPGEKVEEVESTDVSGAGEVKKEAVPALCAKLEAVQKSETGRIFISPRARKLAREKDVDYTTIKGTGPNGRIVERDIKEYLAKQTVKATPLAKKVAEIHGIELEGITGTGAKGKILKQDVLGALREETPAGEGLPENYSPYDAIIPMKGIRKIIAERMELSLKTMAQANHRAKVDMTELLALREKFQNKVSLNALLMKVVAKALKEHKMVNATLTPEGIRLLEKVNIGLAVAVDSGLVVPVVKDVAAKSVLEISEECKMLVDKARDGKLQPQEMSGGTFTISNLGMFGIDSFTAIINPPESAILAVGEIVKTPVVIDDQIVIRPIMKLSLTYNHSIIDGAPAAKFLQRVKQLMENPYLLL
ncbi:2-oxo acid dehydrogenase subunit E2 [Thermanaerosceptrum fracticalcis]|uniref:Dihydrolipoamide acetyltransferase component of pyruvate dehydrogenase complex n=1 Tax=Thermanaerosceptrum fracticalcis TaxID=1712410 RepID=A0A7G6E4E5_THEFR|nr:dihydrolipoamide acetyltransferase family protein [Thermanaerosceptrum fracticalcis]QNB46949.1 2-oxo acid dehydrogenase subunit E2 [Thermanaerosceptrum fracticalcis]